VAAEAEQLAGGVEASESCDGLVGFGLGLGFGLFGLGWVGLRCCGVALLWGCIVVGLGLVWLGLVGCWRWWWVGGVVKGALSVYSRHAQTSARPTSHQAAAAPLKMTYPQQVQPPSVSQLRGGRHDALLASLVTAPLSAASRRCFGSC